MKIIAAVPFALLTLATLGCTQHASTAPAADRPGPAAAGSATKNTFGENKDEPAGSAANARAANYGTEPAPAPDAAPSPGTAAESTPPK